MNDISRVHGVFLIKILKTSGHKMRTNSKLCERFSKKETAENFLRFRKFKINYPYLVLRNKEYFASRFPFFLDTSLQLKMMSAAIICIFDCYANISNSDKSAPRGAVLSGSSLFGTYALVYASKIQQAD